MGITTTSSVVFGVAWAAVAAVACPRPFPEVSSSVTTGTCGSGDSCDDTAIWVHPSEPERSVIVGDDKQGGLLVWSLRGERLQLIDGGTGRVGIWKYGAEPADGDTRGLVDRVGSGTGLVADVEGLGLYGRRDGGGYLIAAGQSSGADTRFVVYDRVGRNAWRGTFRVRGTDSTDGLDVASVSLGPLFPFGLLVVHDARPTPSRHRLVGFERVAAPLGLVLDTGGDARAAGSRPKTGGPGPNRRVHSARRR